MIAHIILFFLYHLAIIYVAYQIGYQQGKVETAKDEEGPIET